MYIVSTCTSGCVLHQHQAVFSFSLLLAPGSGESRERAGSEALYEVDDDDAYLDDSLLATYPATTSEPEQRPHPHSEVEQNWRTAIN